MELVNMGGMPVIFLKRGPAGPAEKPEYFGTNNVLAKSYGGPSNDFSSEWAALRSSLDESSPPIDETHILLWPFNVESPASVSERAKLKFGRKLQKRCGDFGLVWLNDIDSEPIKLDLRGRKEQDRLRLLHGPSN